MVSIQNSTRKSREVGAKRVYKKKECFGKSSFEEFINKYNEVHTIKFTEGFGSRWSCSWFKWATLLRFTQLSFLKWTRYSPNQARVWNRQANNPSEERSSFLILPLPYKDPKKVKYGKWDFFQFNVHPESRTVDGKSARGFSKTVLKFSFDSCSAV